MYRLLFGLICLLPVSTFAGGLYGIAYMDNIVGVNLEWATQHNSFYVMPGYRFGQSDGGADTEEGIRWVAGWRHRMDNGQMRDSGFYLGLLAGDFGEHKNYHRYGAGGELGYQWVAKYTRWTVSGAMTLLDQNDLNEKAEPQFFFGVSVSLIK